MNCNVFKNVLVQVNMKSLSFQTYLDRKLSQKVRNIRWKVSTKGPKRAAEAQAGGKKKKPHIQLISLKGKIIS